MSVPERTSAWRALARVTAATLATAWFASLALAWCSAWTYAGEVAASTRPWLELSVCAPVLACLGVRWRAVALAASVCALASGSAELWTIAAPRETCTGGTTLRLVSANLLAGNPRLVESFAVLRASGADVIALEELTPDAWPHVRTLADEFPHVLVEPPEPASWDPNVWGLAILSRRPFTNARAIGLEPGAFPLLEIEFELAGRRVVLRAIHAPDPSSAERWRARERCLELVARRSWPAESLLCGDLNVTPGSAHFRRLLAATRLRDTRLGFGPQPTWGADTLPFGLAIAIDHVLAGDAWCVRERDTFALPGSDHRGIRSVLVLR